MDTAAENTFAYISGFDSYAASRKHQKENGNLPQVVKKNIGGTRSFIYQKGVKIPAIANRLFENWFTWKKVKLSNGRAAYMLGFVPLTEYPTRGAGFENVSKEGFIKAETTGVYIIEEVAVNVCRVTRIQTVDLHFDGIQKTIMDKAIDNLAKSQLQEANRLQEKFRRNRNKVDAEVRGALVVR